MRVPRQRAAAGGFSSGGVRQPARLFFVVTHLRGSHRARHGFTLVELLTVIAIIATLIGLLLPAVQAAREAARRTACTNQVKQMGLAFQSFQAARGAFPSGGWGYNWIGDASMGLGAGQPGGWAYQVLPFMELQSVFNSGTGGKQGEVQSVVGAFTCATRRSAKLRPACCTPANLGATVANQAKSDYAANYGDASTSNGVYGNPSSNSCPCFLFAASPTSVSEGTSSTFKWPNTSRITGIVFVRSKVRAKDVTDGLSKTYAVGEKYLSPDRYEDGTDGGDDWSMFTGHQDDTLRTTNYNADGYCGPMQDRRGYADSMRFGSAHAAGFQMAMCDGSVHTVSYDIDPEIHRRLGNRADGRTATVTGEGDTSGAGTPYCP